MGDFIFFSSQLELDTGSIERSEKGFQGFRKVFINPQMISETGESIVMDESCLSIPGIRENVTRPETIQINYFDENFEEKTETFSGKNARVIQHEYDHVEGVLFTDRLKPLKRRMLERKLKKIAKGKVQSRYKMVFSKK